MIKNSLLILKLLPGVTRDSCGRLRLLSNNKMSTYNNCLRKQKLTKVLVSLKGTQGKVLSCNINKIKLVGRFFSTHTFEMPKYFLKVLTRMGKKLEENKSYSKFCFEYIIWLKLQGYKCMRYMKLWDMSILETFVE